MAYHRIGLLLSRVATRSRVAAAVGVSSVAAGGGVTIAARGP